MYRNTEINTMYDACNMAARIKNEYHRLKSVYSKVLQRASNHLFDDISVLTESKNRGCNTDKLRFKSEYRYKVRLNQSSFKFHETGELKLIKIGVIHLNLHHELPTARVHRRIRGIIATTKSQGTTPTIMISSL